MKVERRPVKTIGKHAKLKGIKRLKVLENIS